MITTLITPWVKSHFPQHCWEWIKFSVRESSPGSPCCRPAKENSAIGCPPSLPPALRKPLHHREPASWEADWTSRKEKKVPPWGIQSFNIMKRGARTRARSRRSVGGGWFWPWRISRKCRLQEDTINRSNCQELQIWPSLKFIKWQKLKFLF